MQNKEYFEIKGLGGQKTLSGKISVRGSKNAVLPVMASSILFDSPLELTNVPHIEDVERMRELLLDLGAESEWTSKRSLKIDSRKLKSNKLTSEISKQFRASILLSGPILAKYGKVVFPHPGGCVIGARPIDIFEDGFKKMGATVKEVGEEYHIKAPKDGLKGAEIFFKNMSVTATEAFIMAGSLARGKTVLRNCSMEPEVQSLANYLKSCGVNIKGIGTPTIEIIGKKSIKTKTPYKTLPDRLEAGSFLILGALCAKDLTITNCNPDDLMVLTEFLKDAGVPVSTTNKEIIIKNNTKPNDSFTSSNIRTHEHPGFPTDLQAPAAVFLTQTTGEATVFEGIFENRLEYTDSLVSMGADISMWNPHKVMIKGPKPLKSKELHSPDIRAGLALLIASVVAEGESVINNIYYIDRGYERVEERLRDIGLDINRISE